MTRRGLMRTVGVSAGAAATIGGASQLDAAPVGEADALLPVAPIVIGVGATAGVHLIEEWAAGTDGSVDTSDVLEDQIYNVGTSVADGRESFEAEMQANFIDSPEGTSPYANVAWQEIRAAVVEAVVNGESEATAETNATEALDEQTTYSIYNILQRWNTGLEAMIEAAVIDIEESVGSITLNGVPGFGSQSTFDSGWSGMSVASVTSGGYAAAENTSFSLPTPFDQVDEIEEEPVIYGLATPDDSRAIAPGLQGFGDSYGSMRPEISVTHSSLSDAMVLDTMLYHNVIGRIDTEYQSISSNLSTAVTNIYNAVEEGAIDPADVLSSRDIMDEFSSSSAQERMAAEMVAIGANVPESAGYQAKVSHPDLSSDSLWGQLYIRYADGATDPAEPAPGVTIPSADYDMAYLGFHSENAGEYRSRVLSGGSDLQILDVDGLPDQSSVSIGDDLLADSNADVVIYEGSDPPEPIEFPQDHSDWTIVVDGGVNTSSHSPTEVEVDGEKYVLEATGLNAGESVEAVRLVPPTNYSQPVEYVADPTNPDDGNTAEQLQALRDTVDSLEGELGGGGGGFTIPGLGDIGSGGIIVGALTLVAVVIGAGKVAGDEKN